MEDRRIFLEKYVEKHYLNADSKKFFIDRINILFGAVSRDNKISKIIASDPKHDIELEIKTIIRDIKFQSNLDLMLGFKHHLSSYIGSINDAIQRDIFIEQLDSIIIDLNLDYKKTKNLLESLADDISLFIEYEKYLQINEGKNL